MSTAPQCQIQTLRIEAYGDAPKTEDSTKWTIRAIPMVGADQAWVVIVGHLLVLTDGRWGQVLVQGQLLWPEPFESNEIAVECAEKYGPTVAEAVYDTGRRALGAAGALLDIDFKLPKTAPEASLAVSEPEQAVTEVELDAPTEASPD